MDDGHRYSYFEAIFLGRSDDPTLHEYRLSVMFQLVSFSIQYPVLQILNHVMGWLCQMKNVEQERIYSDRLIDMIIEHFVRLSNEQNRMVNIFRRFFVRNWKKIRKLPKNFDFLEVFREN